MSRRWKIGFAVLLLIPILALATGTAFIYRMLGRHYASRFVIGTVMGTRARPLTNLQFVRTPTRVKAPNEYGPVLFVIDLATLLQLPADTDVLVTKENPIYWEGKPDPVRWFQDGDELAKGIRLGTFGQMIMIQATSGKLDFPNRCAQIVLDNPHQKLSSGEDAYTHGIGRLNAAAATGKMKVSVECRQCQADCVCSKKYTAYTPQRADIWFA